MSDNRDKRTWDEVTDAIAGILLLGVGAVAIGLLVAQLLRLGLSRAYADRLAMLLVTEGPFVVSPLQVPGPCEEFERHQAAGWTALFAVAAADRHSHIIVYMYVGGHCVGGSQCITTEYCRGCSPVESCK